MFRTQVYLTELERKNLVILAKQTGQPQSALIREAIDLFIESNKASKRKKNQALKAAAGIWADRVDLPDFNEIRKEFVRKV